MGDGLGIMKSYGILILYMAKKQGGREDFFDEYYVCMEAGQGASHFGNYELMQFMCHLEVAQYRRTFSIVEYQCAFSLELQNPNERNKR